MTADQTETTRLRLPDHKGRRLPAIPGPTADSLLPTGRLKLKGKDAGWDIVNNGWVITLTQDSPASGDPLHLQEGISEFVEKFPALDHVFTYTVAKTHGRSYAVCTLPTISLANAFSTDRFSSLPTAGIELVQSTPNEEKRNGQTPIAIYVAKTREKQLVASSKPKFYLHELFVHWLGAASTRDNEFGVFEKHGDAIDQVENNFGKAVRARYIDCLGNAWDDFTSDALDYLSDEGILDLPGTIHELFTYTRTDSQGKPNRRRLPKEIISNSDKLINDYRAKNSVKLRREYYEEIKTLLTKDPWIPADHVSL